MKRQDKIYIAGHRGMVGSAIHRLLKKEGYCEIIHRTHAELDLTDNNAVEAFFEQQRPQYIFLAAAKVGGIRANFEEPVEFLSRNIRIAVNVIENAYKFGASKLLFLGSSCIYPRDCSQPMKESYLLGGPLETTNRAYALAKIAGIELCQSFNRQYGTNFISAMPTNLYGPNDNYDPASSHVLPALIAKFVDAATKNLPSVTLWGTGRPLREFMHADDLADACLFLMRNADAKSESALHASIYNVGSGQEVSILQLARLIAEKTGYSGELLFDDSQPDGTPRKLLDCERINKLGWRPGIDLDTGLESVIEDYRKQHRY